eukprot:TRINITY_DN100689_c0_g1_i1.p1 TRINITY_DN100689_c0_g1~~TRINITY_DN100689_c0_g1_i1.p1  ORF type:complete len:336 (+),score=48.32 TRINITY_DN100689_c0_g1_i1:21-1028(+)
MARASDADKFIQILVPHPESDVEVTCRRTRYETDEDGLSARDNRRFFCHRAVLKKHCTFSGNNRGDPPEKRRRTRLDLDADEDVVFEILRFVYCGTMYSSPFFRSKAFIELVAIADVLGIDASNEHVQSDMGQLSSNTSFLRDPALTTSLKKLPKVEISEIIIGCRGSSDIMRTNLATLLVELRWHDLSKEDISGLGLDVDLRVVTLPGTLFAQWTDHVFTSIAHVTKVLQQQVAQPGTIVKLVSESEVLAGTVTLRELGVRGGGCSLTLTMVLESSPAPPAPPRPSAPAGTLCHCGQPVRVLTVRREGPNTGRVFYKCGVPAGQCRYFEWADRG